MGGLRQEKPGELATWERLVRRFGGEPVVFIAFALAYVLLTVLGHEFRENSRALTVLWPLGGLMAVVLWVAPLRHWPLFIALQAFIEYATLVVLIGAIPTGWIAVFPVGNILEGIVSAVCVRLLDARYERGSYAPQLLRVLLATAVGAAASGIIGGLAAVHAFFPGYWHQWQLWWAGHWLGAVTVGPVLYVWLMPLYQRGRRLKLENPWEVPVYLAVLMPLATWIFATGAASVLQMPTVLLALLVFVGFRVPPRWAMVVAALTILVAAEAGTRGVGPFAIENPFQRVLLMQTHLVMFAVVSYLLAIIVAEQRVALARVSDGEARYRSFIAMSSEAVWRVELVEPMPLSLLPAARRQWLRRHAQVVERNTHFSRLAGVPAEGAALAWDGAEPWNAVFEEHLGEVGERDCSLDGLRFSVRVDGQPRTFITAFNGVVVDGCLQRLWGVARDISQIMALNTQLLREQERLKNYARQIATAEERARRATAVDLHDGIAQSLVGMAMTLAVARRQAAPELQGLIDETCVNLRQVQERTRDMIADLSPPGLYELGLCPALQWLAEHFSTRDQLQVQLACEVCEDSIPMELRVLAFKLVRELLRNVVKHAGVDNAWVCATGDMHAVRIEVRDAGRGFQWQQDLSGEHASSFGLWSIADRVGEAGGQFRVDTAPGHGARFELVFPLQQAAAAPAVAATGRPGT